MIAEHKRRSNVGVGLGVAGLVAGRLIASSSDGPAVPAGQLLALLGTALFVWGCVEYSQTKGRHPAWGLLGLLSIFGLLALVLMKDRSEERPARPPVPPPPPPSIPPPPPPGARPGDVPRL